MTGTTRSAKAGINGIATSSNAAKTIRTVNTGTADLRSSRTTKINIDKAGANRTAKTGTSDIVTRSNAAAKTIRTVKTGTAGRPTSCTTKINIDKSGANRTAETSTSHTTELVAKGSANHNPKATSEASKGRTAQPVAYSETEDRASWEDDTTIDLQSSEKENLPQSANEDSGSERDNFFPYAQPYRTYELNSDYELSPPDTAWWDTRDFFSSTRKFKY